MPLLGVYTHLHHLPLLFAIELPPAALDAKQVLLCVTQILCYISSWEEEMKRALLFSNLFMISTAHGIYLKDACICIC